MKSNRLPSLAIAACAMALALPLAAQTVRIGLVSPLTGGTSDAGNSVRYGAELAVKEINEVGGYMGRRFELVTRDDKSDPDTGLKIAQELVLGEKVDFTIGFCNTGVAMKALDVFQVNKHILMVPCSQGTGVTAKYPAAQSYIFRLGPADNLNAKFLIEEIVDRRKLKNVAIFADETGYGEGGLQDLNAELGKRGLKARYVARFPLSTTSLATQMRAARDARVDAVITYTVGPPLAAAVKARAEHKMNTPLFATWPLSFRSVVDAVGPDALEGTMMVQTIVHDTLNERRASFLARYQRHANEPRIGSLMSAAQSYDAVHLMLRAMFITKGSTRSDALKNALENLTTPYQGVVTTYTLPYTTDDHEAFSEKMLFLGVWKKGQIDYFYPEDAKRAAYVRRKNAQP